MRRHFRCGRRDVGRDVTPSDSADSTLASFPPGAVALDARLLQRLSPNDRATIHAIAVRLRATPPAANFDPAAAVRNLVSGAFPQIPPGADVDELAFVVLMDATNDQDQDLQMIMNEVQVQTKQKQLLRDRISIVNRDATGMETDAVTPPASAVEMSEGAPPRLQMATDRRSKFVEALSSILKKIEPNTAPAPDEAVKVAAENPVDED